MEANYFFKLMLLSAEQGKSIASRTFRDYSMAFLKKLGIAIAVSIGIGFLALALSYYLSTTGVFVQWQSMGRPPERITKIVGTTMSSVTVETSSQKLYTRDTSSLDGV
jgi:hypothetical protein